MDRPEFILNFRAITDNPEMTQTDSLVFGYIYWMTRLKNEKCYASNETLASLTRLPQSTVRNSLAKLEKGNFIRRLYANPNTTRREEIQPLMSFSSVMGAGLPAGGVLVNQQGGAGKPADTIKKSIKEDTADADLFITEEKPEPRKAKDSATKKYDALCSWLSDLTGAPIPNRAKQYRHLAAARAAEIGPERLKARAEELWAKDFYREEGMDWGAIVSSFNRKA